MRPAWLPWVFAAFALAFILQRRSFLFCCVVFAFSCPPLSIASLLVLFSLFFLLLLHTFQRNFYWIMLPNINLVPSFSYLVFLPMYLHLLFSFSHCANLFCVLILLLLLLLLLQSLLCCCCPFSLRGIFCDIIGVTTDATSRSQGESFCINWANNQLCYIFVYFIHFIPFRFHLLSPSLPKGHFLKQHNIWIVVVVICVVSVRFYCCFVGLISTCKSGFLVIFILSLLSGGLFTFLPSFTVCLGP